MITSSGAHAKNNSGGAITQSSVPEKPVVSMPATNLNIGMDLWNSKMGHNQSGASSAVAPVMGREVAIGEQWTQV